MKTQTVSHIGQLYINLSGTQLNAFQIIRKRITADGIEYLIAALFCLIIMLLLVYLVAKAIENQEPEYGVAATLGSVAMLFVILALLVCGVDDIFSTDFEALKRLNQYQTQASQYYQMSQQIPPTTPTGQ